MSKAAPRLLTERDLRGPKPFIEAMPKAHTSVFEISGGRLGNRFLGGAPVGLHTTVGRKSGRPRIARLIDPKDGEKVILVASRAGMPRNPVRYLNLEANPEVEFETGSAPREMRARPANPGEKQYHWPQRCQIHPDDADYQKRTKRDIALVILEPPGPGPRAAGRAGRPREERS